MMDRRLGYPIQRKNGYNSSNCSIETKNVHSSHCLVTPSKEVESKDPTAINNYKRRRFSNVISVNDVDNICKETHLVTCYFCSEIVKVPITQRTVNHTNGQITHPGEVRW